MQREDNQRSLPSVRRMGFVAVGRSERTYAQRPEGEAMKCPKCGAEMAEDEMDGTKVLLCRRPSCRYEIRVCPKCGLTSVGAGAHRRARECARTRVCKECANQGTEVCAECVDNPDCQKPWHPSYFEKGGKV